MFAVSKCYEYDKQLILKKPIMFQFYSRAQTTFELFGILYQTFACLQLEEFSTNAYYYYLMSSKIIPTWRNLL